MLLDGNTDGEPRRGLRAVLVTRSHVDKRRLAEVQRPDVAVVAVDRLTAGVDFLIADRALGFAVELKRNALGLRAGLRGFFGNGLQFCHGKPPFWNEPGT